MHLVGFIVRIYQDARSPERQKQRNDVYLGTFPFKALCLFAVTNVANAHEFARKSAPTDFYSEKLRKVSDACRKQQ